MEIQSMLSALTADEQSIGVVAKYLGYTVGKNPNDLKSEWKMLFTNKIPNKSRAILALKCLPDLDIETSTMEVRKLYKQVEQLGISFGGSFDAEIAGFVGQKRIIFFRIKNGNRDERLDLNIETVDKLLYQDNFNMMKNEAISVTEDDFWGDYIIDGLKDVFKRELTNHFLQMVSFYRKKLSELITARQYKQELKGLVSEKACQYIMFNEIEKLVEEESFISVLSNVVDTMILRQLMRRFLEGYYGKDNVDPFAVNGIALGIGKGTLDSAIQEVVTIYSYQADEVTVKKLNKQKTIIQQSLNIFNDDEYEATSRVEMKNDSKQRLIELHEKATEQFKSVYGGDLFASSIGEVTTKIEQLIVENDAEFWVKFWADTSSEKYSFRFEDVPPEALEKQYENSMSQNVQIKIENGEPVVFYGEDLQEQKNKGAYYTDEKFVQYMVQQTVEVEFQKRISEVKKAIKTGDKKEVVDKLDELFSMKIADLTAGGGSFLRGAFRQLAEKHDALVGLKVDDFMREKYPMLKSGDEGIFLWEEHILHHMIYGVDIDYKAILISSLSLMLSSLQHRPSNHQLPKLIGRTLIHQNSLMSSVPFYQREEIYKPMAKEIKKLLKLKKEDFTGYERKRMKLQHEVIKHAQEILKDEIHFLHVEAIELNFPEVFFDENGILKENGGFDCIVGNPPWEIWKPNSDEFFSQYDEGYLAANNKKAKIIIQNNIFEKIPNVKNKWEQYENRIRVGSEYFRDEKNYRFQRWIVEGRRTSSDINLYKISVERFSQLLKKNHSMSILVPDNLMTDLGSTGLRHLIFEQYDIQEFLSFENTKGIFTTIHRSYKFAVLTLNKSEKKNDVFSAFFYKTTLDELNNNNVKMDYPVSMVKEAEPEKYSLFEPRDKIEFDLYKKIKLAYPTLLETKVIELSNDFHKTNDSKKFVDLKQSDIPLYEGKLMNQFKLVQKPEEGVKLADVIRKTNDDYKYFRIGIRSVARETDKRALIATILPRNTTATNSLLMQKNVNDEKIYDSLFTLGVLNSYTLDFVLRKLITINVNQTYLKQLPIPLASTCESADEIIQIVKRLLMLNGELYDELDNLVPGESFSDMNFDQLIAELNARVAIIYDLTREDLINLLRTFETPTHKKAVKEEAQRIIEVYDRLKEEIQ